MPELAISSRRSHRQLLCSGDKRTTWSPSGAENVYWRAVAPLFGDQPVDAGDMGAPQQ